MVHPIAFGTPTRRLPGFVQMPASGIQRSTVIRDLVTNDGAVVGIDPSMRAVVWHLGHCSILSKEYELASVLNSL